MNCRRYEPAFPLRTYVDFLWRLEGSEGSASRERVYPDGSMALVIQEKKPTATYFIDGQAHSIRVPFLAGAYSRSFEMEPSHDTGAIGVHFRPGAARLFFPVAAHELHNIDLSLSELDAAEADRLLNETCGARGERQFQVVEGYLHRKLRSTTHIPPVIGYAIEQFSQTRGACSVRRVQVESGLSHTRFIQLFREYVGLPPKLFGRVRRFQSLIADLRRGLPVNWAGLATDCGYFDQAHLIRDFRAFAGVTPHAYMVSLTERAESLAYLRES